MQDEEAAGVGSAVPTPDGASAQEEEVGDDGAEAATDTAVPAEPSPAPEAVSPPSTEEPANDNQSAEELTATGTEYGVRLL